MIYKVNKGVMIFGKVMILMMLSGCDSAQNMKDFYIANKDSLIQMRVLSKTLVDNYTFEQITVRKKDGELELMFLGGSSNSVTMYLSPLDFTLISEHPVSKCSAEALQTFRTMYQENAMRQVLRLFEETEPDAIRISQGALFVALGRPLKSPNVNLEGGILMTFQPGVADKSIVEEIDTNVYLYDTLVY